MPIVLAMHIFAGSLGLVSGFAALYAAKGQPLHRKAGMVFVCVMLTMTATGSVIAAVRGAAPALNIPAALTTSYLVITGLTAVRPLARGQRALQTALMLVAFAVALFCLALGFEAAANGGTRKGLPAFPFFMFAFFGLMGAIGDWRMLRSGALRGAPRVARHLWRMSLALFVAAMSFFIGQAKVIPEPLRIMPLLILPPLAVLVTMLYWLWRVRFRRTLRGVTLSVSPVTSGGST